MTKEQADNFLKKNSRILFDKNPNLISLSTIFNKNKETYEIEFEFSTKEKFHLPEFFGRIKKLDEKIPFQITYGNIYKTISKNKNNYQNNKPIKSGDLIKNFHRSKYSHGELSILFKVKINNTFRYYFISCFHVAGRKKIKINEEIERVIDFKKNKFEVIGNFKFGRIYKNCDILCSEIKSNFLINTQHYKTVSIYNSLSRNDQININNTNYKIHSTNSNTKIKDNYLYNPEKVLENQIRVKTQLIPGESGSICLTSDKKNIIGIACANNNGFLVVNSFKIISKKIARKLNVKENNITYLY